MKKQALHIEPFGTVHIELRGVNNKRLTDEVVTFTAETLHNTYFHDFAEEHDRDTIIEYITHFYSVMMDANLIEQFDIIFDKRNNTRTQMNTGMFEITSKFKQTHCLNHTTVTFLLGGKK